MANGWGGRRALSAALAGCIGAVGLAAAIPASAEVTLQYWGAWKEGQPIIDAFNKAYAGKIKVVPAPTDVSKLAVAVASGTPPDVVKIDRFTNGSDASSGLLTDLTPFVQADAISSQAFWPVVWQECVYQGKVTCIPSGTDDRALFYNKATFSQVGLDANSPPRTWDEAIADGNKLDVQDASGKFTRVGFNPDQGNWTFFGWLLAAGGQLLDPSLHKVVWNSAAGISAATFMADRVQHYGGNPPADVSQLESGQAAMVMAGEWNIASLIADKNGIDWGAGGAPRPAGMEGQPVTWSGGFAWAIPKGAKHPQEAWTFIKFWLSDQNQITLHLADGDIPATLSASHDPKFYSLNPLIPVVVNLMAGSHFRPVVPDGSDLWNLYTSQIGSEIAAGKEAPKAILNQTAALGQTSLDETWARVEGAGSGS